MWIRRAVTNMGNIVISYKVFPTGIDVDLEKLKQQIEKTLPSKTSVYGFQIEPVAFGLNALIAHIVIPEDETGLLENVEEELGKISTVSQIQTIMVRRTR
jgi:elongation factor 1-beta